MKLPPFTFILGPKGCGKTTLQTLMVEDDNRTAPCGFDEPIRETVLTIFYPDQLHVGIDLREDEIEKQQLPFLSHNIGDFMASLRALLRGFSPTLIGDLAKKRVAQVIGPGYQRAVFDDASTPDDIRPFALAFGARNCLLLFIERQGYPTTPFLRTYDNLLIPKIMLRNVEGQPKQMLERLTEMLPHDLGLAFPHQSAEVPADPPQRAEYEPKAGEL